MSILCFLPPYFESIYILLALLKNRYGIRKGRNFLRIGS
ncbi:hypothetical protein RINTU1_29690 [Candidatus Regiella insecticola]|uniref:Uncharacterized protein n=1 Tax=Candidatus Regiella insecticola TaxID=138073 RepID=A0A6L2ZRA6_9ENTR|nr:hypothetical protein RINTU1_29690 [Candidatus Regiella insecticola]